MTAYQDSVRTHDSRGIAEIDAGQWDDLAANAIDPNPFYTRAYVLAGLGTIDRDAGLRAVSVHHPDTGRLIGLFPFRLQGLPFRTAVGSANLYQMSGVPLIHAKYAELAVQSWLDAMHDGRIPARWSFPHLDLSSNFAALSGLLSEGRAFDLIPLAAYPRAKLTRLEGGFDAHLKSVMSKSRVKDIQRTLRRLEEAGELRFERATDPDLVAERVEQFLVMEHGGWKGEAGTSFLSEPAHAAFVRRAFAWNGATIVDSLLLDGEPIAISINLKSGDTLFTPKCAYDEAYRRFSPGLALEYLVIRAFYEGGEETEMDAATTVGGHLVQGLWNEQKTMAVALIGPDDWRTQLTAQTYTAATNARTTAKKLLGGKTIAAARQFHRTMPYVLRRIVSWAQGASVLILYV